MCKDQILQKIDYLVFYIHSNNTQFYLNFNQVHVIPVIIEVTNTCIFKNLSIFLLISLYIIALKNCNIIFWIITLFKKIFLRDSCKSLVLLIITCILYIYTSNLRRWDGENMNKSKDRNISEKKTKFKKWETGSH